MLPDIAAKRYIMMNALRIIFFAGIVKVWTFASQPEQDFQLVFPRLIDVSERYVSYRVNDFEKYSPFALPHFSAFGKNFTLHLNQNDHLLANDFMVEKLSSLPRVNDLFTKSERRSQQGKGCQYVGTVKRFPNSSVAVNMCNGLNGIMVLDSDEYYIEPISVHANYRSDDGMPHALYKRSWLNLPNNINDDLLVTYDDKWNANDPPLYVTRLHAIENQNRKRGHQKTDSINSPHTGLLIPPDYGLHCSKY